MNEVSEPMVGSAHDGAAASPELCRIEAGNLPALLDRIGWHGVRYGLVVVIAWIGAMKFTAYEAEGISGLVANSPLMGWAYRFLSHRQFSMGLGAVELGIAGLIAVGPCWPRAAVVGALAAVAMFLTTLSFMVTTPGVFEPAAGGFPALSVVPGQFLLKDVVLLGASVLLVSNAMSACSARRNQSGQPSQV